MSRMARLYPNMIPSSTNPWKYSYNMRPIRPRPPNTRTITPTEQKVLQTNAYRIHGHKRPLRRSTGNYRFRKVPVDVITKLIEAIPMSTLPKLRNSYQTYCLDGRKPHKTPSCGSMQTISQKNKLKNYTPHSNVLEKILQYITPLITTNSPGWTGTLH